VWPELSHAFKQEFVFFFQPIADGYVRQEIMGPSIPALPRSPGIKMFRNGPPIGFPVGRYTFPKKLIVVRCEFTTRSRNTKAKNLF
jgi:hypothetical protein